MKKLLALLALPLFASCPTFEVGAEALYWRPSYCGLEYALETSGNNFVQEVSEPRSDWGYRLFATYRPNGCCPTIYVNWYSFEQTHTSSATGPTLVSPFVSGIGTSASFRGHDRLHYADIAVGRHMISCDCYSFGIYGGIAYVDLKHDERYRLTSTNVEEASQHNDLYGVGPAIALSARYRICNGFGAFAKIKTALLIGEQKHRFTAATVDNSVETVKCTQLTPELGGRLGLDYRCDCGCWFIVGHAAYEYQYYFDAIRRTEGNQLAATFFPYETIGMGFGGASFGLTFGLKL